VFYVSVPDLVDHGDGRVRANFAHRRDARLPDGGSHVHPVVVLDTADGLAEVRQVPALGEAGELRGAVDARVDQLPYAMGQEQLEEPLRRFLGETDRLEPDASGAHSSSSVEV
jgi:hypothetical protein